MSLASDLSNLALEAKRRHPQISKLAEAALALLKKLGTAANVLDPLLEACAAEHKVAQLGLTALQKVIVGKQVPPKDLSRVVEALDHALAIPECQLRVLQCLPPMMDKYSSEIVEQKQTKPLLVVCTTLSGSSDIIVQNTALATLQQMFALVFDGAVLTAPQTDNEAEAIFIDLVSLMEGQSPTYFPAQVARSLGTNQVMELVERVMAAHTDFFHRHPATLDVVRERLVPQVLQVLNNPSLAFAQVVRAMRILVVMVETQIDQLEIEGELLISALNHLLSTELLRALQLLVLEVYLQIFGNFNVVEKLYTHYDGREGKKSVVEEILFVVANYVDNNNQVGLTTVQPFSPPAVNPGGPHVDVPKYLSAKLGVRVLLLDHLDKADAPSVPDTYATWLAYHVTLSFCNGVTQVVQSVDPNDEKAEGQIEFANGVIGVLFAHVLLLLKHWLYSRIDNEGFHQFVKTYQRFTHTTGLLGLVSARDTLLQMLSTAIIVTAKFSKKPPQSNTQLLALLAQLALTELVAGKHQSSEPKKELLNSRQFGCLRAMANITLALGLTLGELWAIVWVTLQWGDSLIDELPQERTAFEQATARITDVGAYPPELFRGVIQLLVTISDACFLTGGDDLPHICPANKMFFVEKLVEVAAVDPTKFLVGDPDTWAVIQQCFDKIITLRSVSTALRLQFVSAYARVLANVADAGFTNAADPTAALVLGAMKLLLDQLYALPVAEETIVSNCETDITLQCLQLLHALVDRYDQFAAVQWHTVFELVNTPFRRNQPELVAPAFDVLKLVVNDFVQGLPDHELQILIDTLARFCDVADINVSFSSVLYFWGIADLIRERVGQDGTTYTSNLDKLPSLSGKEFYYNLDLYLLQKLAEVTLDRRAQVRDGALQTVFQIIESRPAESDWDVVFRYCIDTIYLLHAVANDPEWLELSKLILSGLTTVYTKFLMGGQSQKWEQLVDYLQTLTKLQWVPLLVIVFTTFKDLLLYFDTLSLLQATLFFNFWLSVKVEYDFVNQDYPELVATYLLCFPPLFKVLPSDFDCSPVIAVLHKCSMYPVVAADDTKRALPIQKQVLDNVEAVSARLPDPCIQFLASVAAFPATIRARIAAKVAGHQIKVPTFVAMLKRALALLEKELDQQKDFAALVDGNTATKVLRHLVEVVASRVDGWENANTLALSVVRRMMATVDHWKDPNSVDTWRMIIGVLEVNLDDTHVDGERELLAQYHALWECVLPSLLAHGPTEVINEYVETIYRNSFLYADVHPNSDVSEVAAHQFDDDIGSTAPLELAPRQQTHMACMRQLMEFLTYQKLKDTATEWWVRRLALALRRYLADARLLGKCPMPQTQKKELALVLQGLDCVDRQHIQQLYPLLVRVDAKPLLMKLI